MLPGAQNQPGCAHSEAAEAALTAQQAGLLDAVADRWPSEPVSEVDRVARLLIATYERVEHTTVPVSSVASFADMARAVVADTAVQVQQAHASSGLVLCVIETRD